MTTITQEERAELRRSTNKYQHVLCSTDHIINRLLDALESAESARDAAIREYTTIATDYGRAKGYADGMEIRAKSAESRVAELERQRDRLASKLSYACHSVGCPMEDDCPFPLVRCEGVTPEDWINACPSPVGDK